jgi:hypothetical protein
MQLSLQVGACFSTALPQLSSEAPQRVLTHHTPALLAALLLLYYCFATAFAWLTRTLPAGGGGFGATLKPNGVGFGGAGHQASAKSELSASGAAGAVQAGGDLGGESNEALRQVMRQEMAALAALTDASCKEALRQVIREEMSTLVKDAFAKHIPTLTVDSA